MLALGFLASGPVFALATALWAATDDSLVTRQPEDNPGDPRTAYPEPPGRLKAWATVTLPYLAAWGFVIACATVKEGPEAERS